MASSKIGNTIKVLGFLTIVGTVLAKALPLLKQENPKLKKKLDHIGGLLNDLKEDIVELTDMARSKKK